MQSFCQFRHNKELCDYHKQYGSQQETFWQRYEQADWNVELTHYYSLTPAQLFDKYEQVSDDIAYLWNKNPEYIDACIKGVVRKVAITVNVTIAALAGGYAVGGVLQAAGFKMAGNMASLVPLGSAVLQNGARFSVQAALRSLITNVMRGKFWADLGLTMMVMVGDGLMAEGAFYAFYTLDEELMTPVREGIITQTTVETRKLVHEIVNPPLSEEQQKAFNQSQEKREENKELTAQLREAVRKQFEKEGWGSDENTAYLTHHQAVVTLYALEYLRAELADLSDGLRYRKAAVDLAQIYFSDDLTNLYNREELDAIIKQSVRARWKKLADEIKYGPTLMDRRFGAHR